MPERKTQTGPIFHDLAERLKKRGIVVIFSDLFDDVALADGRAEAFSPSPARSDPVSRARSGRTRFSVPADDDVQGPGAIARRAGRSAGACARPTWPSSPSSWKQIQKGCRAQQIDYVLLRTDQSLDIALSSYLASRMNRTK